MEGHDLDVMYQKAMEQAAHGKKVWMELVEAHDLGPKGVALLLPEETPQYHEASARLLPVYMKKTGMTHGVVLRQQGGKVCHWEIPLLESGNIFIEFRTKEDMDALLRFYSFYEFTDRLIIGSLELPAGRLGASMIGKKGLTMEDAIGAMLYDIYQ